MAAACSITAGLNRCSRFPPADVKVAGQGSRPRTWQLISVAGFAQSTRPIVLTSGGAEGIGQRPAAEFGKFLHQGGGSIILVDGYFFRQENIAGIHAFIHLHDCYPGFVLTVEQGPLYRGGAAIFGQQ